MRTLKVCITSEETSQELAISHHLRSLVDHGHPGQSHLRMVSDNFDVKGPSGVHRCLVFPALGMSLTQVRDLFNDRALDKTLLQRFLYVIFTALDFMHQAGVVHTGTHHNLTRTLILADILARFVA